MKPFRVAALMSAVIVAVSLQALAAKDDDPREKLETAIPELIRLLEDKKYVEVLSKFVPPETIQQINQSIGVQTAAGAFAQSRAANLLAAAKQIEGTEPKLSDDGKTATFELKEPVNEKKELNFVKIGKFWYIKGQ